MATDRITLVVAVPKPTKLERLLELSAMLVTLLAVWLVANLDIRGQYVMCCAQVMWLLFSYLRGLRFMLVQSAILLAMSIQAIIVWRGVLG